MNKRPGLLLEDYLRWCYCVVIKDKNNNDTVSHGSPSLRDILCPQLTEEQFRQIVNVYEPYRETIEQKLLEYDGSKMTWRYYSSYSFDFLPEILGEYTIKLIKKLTESTIIDEARALREAISDLNEIPVSIEDLKIGVSEFIKKYMAERDNRFTMTISETPKESGSGLGWSWEMNFNPR